MPLLPNFKMSHMLLYIPSPLQLVSNSETLFPGIKIRPFHSKGDGVEISLNVTLSQMPFEFHPFTRLCCFTLSFIFVVKKKKHFFVNSHTHTLFTVLISLPATQLPCGFPLLLFAYKPFSCVTNPADNRTESKLYTADHLQNIGCLWKNKENKMKNFIVLNNQRCIY